MSRKTQITTNTMSGTDIGLLRAKLGVTQAELAELLGLEEKSGRHYVSNLENGNRPVSRRIEQTLKLLSRTLTYRNQLVRLKKKTK